MKTEIRFFSGRRISEKSLRDRLKVPQDSPTSFQEKVDDSYGFTVKRIRKRESGKENPGKRIIKESGMTAEMATARWRRTSE